MEAKALLELTRPINIIVATVAVIISASITKEINFKVVYAILTVAFVTAGGNAINDYFDYEIDRINKPSRPLPSNRISLDEVKIYAATMFIVGCFISIFINWICFLIAILATFFLYIYAKYLKYAGFPGNLTIAGLTGMVIVFAGLSVSNIERIFYVALFAFLINLGREIIKDVEDYEGDKSLGAKTLPINYGLPKAVMVSLVPLIGIIITAPVPYFYGLYNYLYIITIIFGVDLPLLIIIYKIYKDPSTSMAKRVQKYLKGIIIIGIVGLYVGL